MEVSGLFCGQAVPSHMYVGCVFNSIQWNLSIKDTINKEHLSNEDSVCCPNHIELCANLPLNQGHLCIQDSQLGPNVVLNREIPLYSSYVQQFQCYLHFLFSVYWTRYRCFCKLCHFRLHRLCNVTLLGRTPLCTEPAVTLANVFLDSCGSTTARQPPFQLRYGKVVQLSHLKEDPGLSLSSSLFSIFKYRQHPTGLIMQLAFP